MTINKLLSIVTPTYNRADYLPQCYQSLKDQTDQHFEWIIVDDGSTDNTAKVVASFQAETPEMQIQYVKKANGGKHTALNASHPFIHGDYVLVLDSDDTLLPMAVEEIYRGWAQHDQEDVGIVIFLKGNSADEPHSYAKEEHVPVDMFHKHTVRLVISDCCDVYRAEPFKKYPYPVFDGERFLSETILWNKMAFDYKIVYINKVIYILKFLEDGLTKSGRSMRIRMPEGGKYASNLQMDSHYPLKLRIKNGLLYTSFGFFGKKSPAEMIKTCCSPMLATLCMPFGFLLYLYWGHKYNR